MPGYGDQRAGETLTWVAENGFTGHVVLEVNSRKSGSRSRREAELHEALDFTREHLAAGSRSFVVDATGTAQEQ